MNEVASRMLSVLLGVSFHVLAFGHLMHHKLNRSWQSELVVQKTVKESASYYFTLLGGLYLTEIASSVLMACLPKRIVLAVAAKKKLLGDEHMLVAGRRYFYDKSNIAALRADTLCVIVLYAFAFIAYGAYYPLLMLFLLSRMIMISFMDNVYHYGTGMHIPGKNLSLSLLVEKLLLHANYHGMHHASPHIPWLHLPKIHSEHGQDYDGSFLSHGFMQLRGPIQISGT